MFAARDLPLLAVFASVARHGSITAAARELGVSKSVVSDQLRALEARCAVRLIERTTRRMSLTQVGEKLLAVAAAAVDAARDAGQILEEHRQALTGTLRVATTHDLSARLVAPVVARVAAEHAQLRVDIVSDDSLHDLIAERFDVAVRLGAPRDSGFVMRRLCVFPERIFAAPALAAAYAQATRPRELRGAPWVRHSVVNRSATWRFRGPRGEIEEVSFETRAQANTGDGVRALLLGGIGLGVLPEYQVAHDLRRGALVTICPAWMWRRVTLYALLPSGKRQPRRVELFLGALKEGVVREGLAGQDPAVPTPASA